MALSESAFEEFGSVDDGRIQNVIAALEKQPHLRASQLASMVELSADHLGRLFKRRVGTSIATYALTLRLEKAAELLATTFHSVKQIRNEVGIPDVANFRRQFKQRYGMSPSVYRKSANVGFDPQKSELTH
jgi:transcriptional regulator GlxA family with amidase domain